MLDIIFSVPYWKKLQKFDNAELTNCEERLTLIHCYLTCKLGQILKRAVPFNIEIPIMYNHSIMHNKIKYNLNG